MNNVPIDVSNLEDNDTLLNLYKQMVYARIYEEKCNQIYRSGKAGGYLHVYIGMEALSSGWMNCLNVGHDYVITAYRDHAHALALGSDPVAIFAEIMGRSGGLSRGKGGSMHLYDPEKGLYGGWGIVGGNVPLGAGLALGAKYKGEDSVVLNFMGDGAANAGVVYESLNMAKLWNLPCIFIIENNEFAMGTRLEYHASDTELYKRGYPFGMKHERIDGMDVLNVIKQAKRIIADVRENPQPYLIEMMCYRYAGHGAADNDQALYRTKEELEEAKLKDPVRKLEKLLVDKKVLNDELIESITEEYEELVEDQYQEADSSPFPELHEVYDNVYTDITVERGH